MVRHSRRYAASSIRATCLTFVCILFSCGLAGNARAQAVDDARCLQCHGQERIKTDSEEDLRVRVVVPPGQTLPPRKNKEALFVTRDHLRPSVHASVSCVACHSDAQTLPHAAKLGTTNCGSCHAAQSADYRQGIHAEKRAEGKQDAPDCSHCHGGHNIRRRNDPAANTHPLHVIRICGDCHATHRTADAQAKDGRKWVESYLESVHGQAVTKAGLIVAATCADCHGYHDVRRSGDARSSVSREKVAQTCGRCHVGINETFAESIHGQVAKILATQPGRASLYKHTPPVCNDCHSAHAISRSDTAAFQRDIVGECGTCHADLYKSYRESYHGQVQQLGSGRAARCSDCHGAHNIRPPSDPKSTLSPRNKADTCANCHSGAHDSLKAASLTARENFVRFDPHSNYRDRKRDPVLFYIWLYFIVLMSVTFTFWGLHSIAWFVRGSVNWARSGPRPAHGHRGRAIKRFNTLNRWTHGLVIISFFGLTLTGLPLKFSDQPWAAWLMAALGGPIAAGNVHRACAVLVVIYMAMHGAQLARLIVRRLTKAGELFEGTSFLGYLFGPHSMLPTLRDWREFRQMARWFFGRGPKPTFDRWTYWEKFDYWADAVGTFIIGGSGLLLWFPAFFSEYLSGYWFNIATVVHGYEALLAVGFIFTIHFFNAHLRWEKFPVDDVIFTGQVPEEEFREERGLQYERMNREGAVESARVPEAPQWLRILARWIGAISLTIGGVLVILIIYAGLKG